MSPNTVRNHAKRQVNPLRLTKIGRRTVLLAIDLAEFLAAQPAKEGTDEAFSKRANENWRKRRAHATTETTTEAVTA